MPNVSGYSANTFSAGEQPTTTVWNELWSNDAAFNALLGPAFPVATTAPAWQYAGSAFATGGLNSLGTTDTLVPGCALTVTIPTGATMTKVTGTIGNITGSVADGLYCGIYASLTVSGSPVQKTQVYAGTAGTGQSLFVIYLTAATAGTLDFCLAASTSTSGSGTVDVTAPYTPFILVEYC